ncbi:glycosyltransferase family 2 protein [Zunongwangia endophytica]|uniref:Glycosyltransferase family 2 protein n=1 Tax=Zunongwangia endophytica TaxID=1808945 RepID=A0ABV8H6I4_9FLAO|nr:glycosyltransferase family A protein [Zunongwangia endophytica]MDN3595034.1 glycosyltransferase family A protein [Zunongwangia endophytica]
MLSLVLTYRNRQLEIVKRCLDSLREQSDQDFKVFLVNYGSSDKFTTALEKQIKNYNFIDYIFVSTYGQLWNKSRAINIALQKCNSPLFLMGDIDLLYHPEMVRKCKQISQKNDIVYFKYAFLDKKESSKDGTFFDYNPSFTGNEGVTGTTLYKTSILKKINGYDEFYHGWGAEDTDVHLRLKNAGFSVHFFDEEILVKHQWHPKQYRSKKSEFPYHTNLEKINHRYMMMQNQNKVTHANLKFVWGEMPNIVKFTELRNPINRIILTSECNQFDAFLTGVFPILSESSSIKIKTDSLGKSIKNRLKKTIGKKYIRTYSMEYINNKLLEAIILQHRLSIYHYQIDWEKEELTLKIVPDA